MYLIGLVGIGFVGNAISRSFRSKNISVLEYDKYKNIGVNNLTELLFSDFIFICLPTEYDEDKKCYDKSAIEETCFILEQNNYKGIIIIKSTIEPETTNILSIKFPKIKICHNPEFLSAKTAFEDFDNQEHIVLGKGYNCTDEDVFKIKNFYEKYYPKPHISICDSTESESMKIFCNSFYASKIMIFNEFYLLCQKNKTNFENVRNLMLKNKWINPMHTSVPGSDGFLGFGGACFPKDTSALLSYMVKKDSKYKIIKSVIDEKNELRKT